jgi:hypothetical protein
MQRISGRGSKGIAAALTLSLSREAGEGTRTASLPSPARGRGDGGEGQGRNARTPACEPFGMKPFLAATLIGLAAFAAPAVRAAERPVVVELFTSQGCSSCPPADAVLAELAKRPGILALAFHVDYWDRLGWKDPFSSPMATARQRAYARLLGLRTVYTPQMVVDGADEFVGSDRRAVARALDRAKARAGEPGIGVELRREGGFLVVRVASVAAPSRIAVQLVAFAPAHVTRVTAGENGGRVLANANVVRAVDTLGTAGTEPAEWRAAADPALGYAALVQGPDGRVLGAATVPPGG